MIASDDNHMSFVLRALNYDLRPRCVNKITRWACEPAHENARIRCCLA
jgi:hypothetical protein